MDPKTAAKLLAINWRFYDEFGNAFAATRRRIQPGTGRILASIPVDTPADWLDLGCGSGALGRIWADQGRSGSYTGMDFSGPLLTEARKITADASNQKLEIRYVEGDLMDSDWPECLAEKQFDGILALASLHHIPGAENHQRIFGQVRDLLADGGSFVFSVWQFQNSAKLMKRVQPWSLAGIPEAELDPGDTLLDWRFALPENGEKSGLRYVHLFTEEEIGELAGNSGFCITEQFYSDGAEGNLALYTRLRKIG